MVWKTYREKLLDFLNNDHLYSIRKNHGMYLQIQWRVEDLDEETLTVKVSTGWRPSDRGQPQEEPRWPMDPIERIVAETKARGGGLFNVKTGKLIGEKITATHWTDSADGIASGVNSVVQDCLRDLLSCKKVKVVYEIWPQGFNRPEVEKEVSEYCFDFKERMKDDLSGEKWTYKSALDKIEKYFYKKREEHRRREELRNLPSTGESFHDCWRDGCIADSGYYPPVAGRAMERWRGLRRRKKE